MHDIRWNAEKNEQLKARYGFGFERVVASLAEGGFVAERAHPNREIYGHQRQLVVNVDGYAWIVPYVSDGDVAFWKTMFPSRRATRDLLGSRD